MFRQLAIGLGVTLAAVAGHPVFAEDHSIYYGSRAGMQLTTVSKKGIGTANAVIIVKHTPKDSKAYCVGYELDNSMACVKRTMAEVKVGDRVTANCQKRIGATQGARCRSQAQRKCVEKRTKQEFVIAANRHMTYEDRSMLEVKPWSTASCIPPTSISTRL